MARVFNRRAHANTYYNRLYSYTPTTYTNADGGRPFYAFGWHPRRTHALFLVRKIRSGNRYHSFCDMLIRSFSACFPLQCEQRCFYHCVALLFTYHVHLSPFSPTLYFPLLCIMLGCMEAMAATSFTRNNRSTSKSLFCHCRESYTF